MFRKIIKSVYLFLAGFWYTEKRYAQYQQKYLLIPGCQDIDLKNQYLKGNLARLNKPISFYYDELFNLVSGQIAKKSPFSIIRASDGEAFFLQRKVVGNISTRHFTQNQDLKNVNLDLFKEGLVACDLRLGEMYRNNRFRFKKIFGKNIFSEIPFEAAYALMATRRLFKSSWRMGIIGSDKKIEIIKQLLKSPEYRQYIGRESFEDYISVPERGTANDPEGLANSIKTQLKNDIDIYLVGIGIAKLVVLNRLKENQTAVFFDAGAGISALAGLVGRERQYFADWTNFRLKGYDYSQVDTMDADMEKGTIIDVSL